MSPVSRTRSWKPICRGGAVKPAYLFNTFQDTNLRLTPCNPLQSIPYHFITLPPLNPVQFGARQPRTSLFLSSSSNQLPFDLFIQFSKIGTSPTVAHSHKTLPLSESSYSPLGNSKLSPPPTAIRVNLHLRRNHGSCSCPHASRFYGFRSPPRRHATGHRKLQDVRNWFARVILMHVALRLTGAWCAMTTFSPQ